MPGSSVLVVEDTDEIRELVVTVLTKAGMDVRAVSSGAACLAELRSRQPDVIVLDLGLPDTDGTEVCRQIRAESECYVLMLTARAEEVDLLIGLAVGADGYMAKPFSPRELVARVQAMLRRPRGKPRHLENRRIIISADDRLVDHGPRFHLARPADEQRPANSPFVKPTLPRAQRNVGRRRALRG